MDTRYIYLVPFRSVPSFPYLVDEFWISHCFGIFRTCRQALTLEFLHESFFNKRENLFLGRISRDMLWNIFYFYCSPSLRMNVVLNVSIDFEDTWIISNKIFNNFLVSIVVSIVWIHWSYIGKHRKDNVTKTNGLFTIILIHHFTIECQLLFVWLN